MQGEKKEGKSDEGVVGEMKDLKVRLMGNYVSKKFDRRFLVLWCRSYGTSEVYSSVTLSGQETMLIYKYVAEKHEKRSHYLRT